MTMSRRDFTSALAALPAAPAILRHAVSASAAPGAPRIRAITASVALRTIDDPAPLAATLDFLARAKRAMTDAGYEVQTVRAAVAWPLTATTPTALQRAQARWRALDELADAHGTLLSAGPLDRVVRPVDLPAWTAELIAGTRRTSGSIAVLDANGAPDPARIRAAAETIVRLATSTPQGLGNFRFAAAAGVPAGTPFFPVSWFDGAPAFGIGFEGAGLVTAAVREAADRSTARERIRDALDGAFGRVAALAERIGERERRRYLGIDASPAPGIDRSIGEAIEALSGEPFGSPATLAACALVTDALKSLRTRTCGYSGLMLPVLEDPVLAKRAAEHRFGLQHLLLYSSVCGTGLDVAPIPGDTGAERIAALVGDVAALSAKWRKPLSARLLPVPGRAAGEPVHFDDPVLTDSIVLPAG